MLQHPVLCNELIVPLGGCCVLSFVSCFICPFIFSYIWCSLPHLVTSVKYMNNPTLTLSVLSKNQLYDTWKMLDYIGLHGFSIDHLNDVKHDGQWHWIYTVTSCIAPLDHTDI